MAIDWLLGTDRHETAADHIYAAAADLIAAHGFDHFDIDAVARRAHCSRATVYRHTGGKTRLRETVMARAATRITAVVDAAVSDRTGADRVHTVLSVAIREIRADPVLMAFLESDPGARAVTTFAASPALLDIAAEFIGLRDDPVAAAWLIRTVLSLLLWPAEPDIEAELLRRFTLPILESGRRPETLPEA